MTPKGDTEDLFEDFFGKRVGGGHQGPREGLSGK